MDKVIDRYRRRQAPSPTHCEPKPQPCSTCGMLECLCRPRFFAGQVLTADDLNRLDYYVRAKHRLHNRQLHGWGVVNGLEVSCDVCGPGVVVGCGYALSPCGEDIVVCEPVVVDVCRLIKECKEIDRVPCDPPRQPPPAGCEQGEEEWILAIRYTESPTRAVKPLMPSHADACGTSACRCGASGGNHCTCGHAASRPKPRNAPVQCEPTVICEGFDFEVYRKPQDTDPGDDERRLRLNPESELYKRFECCVELLITRMPKMPGSLTPSNIQQNLPAWHQWMCRFKDFLQNYLATRPGYNCELLARLNTIVCPPLTAGNASAQVLQTIVLLVMVWLDALLACYCSALLPPCPTAHPDGLVPLASIRVSANPCRVLSICNWTRHRKFATTFPSLQYWLSIFPFGVELRRMIERTCCFQIMSILPERDRTAPLDFHFAADRSGGDNPGHDNPGHDNPGHGNPSDFASAQPLFYERAARRLNPTSAHPLRLAGAVGLAARAARREGPLDPQKFFESVFLPDRDKGTEHLSGMELDNLPQFLALNQMLRPVMMDAFNLEALAPILGFAAPGEMRAADESAAAPDTAAMREELNALRKELAAHAAEIKRLKEAGRRRKDK